MTLEAAEKGIAKAPAPTTTDGLNAYRSAPWMPPADGGAAKPSVVDNGQLVFSALSLNSDTTAKTTPVADTKTATTQTTPADTAQTQFEANVRAAITCQGAIADPGDCVPMWMRMTNNHGLDMLIQQQYGESALNGFHKGETVPGIDAPASPNNNTADNSADTAAAILNDTAAGGGNAAA